MSVDTGLGDRRHSAQERGSEREKLS
jgi:hypothetical protein